MTEPKVADNRCAICGWKLKSHDFYNDGYAAMPLHEYVPKFNTNGTDELFCPWCGVENSSDDIGAGGVIGCSSCEREFDVEVDYTIVYSTARLKCYACRKDMSKGLRTKLGGERWACSTVCVITCNEAYDAYRADQMHNTPFPSAGFAKVVEVKNG